MQLTAHCPSDEELKLLANGNLPDPSFEAAIDHLESCERCQVRLSNFDQVTDQLTESVSKITPDDIENVRCHLGADFGDVSESVASFLGQYVHRRDLPPALSPPCHLGPYEIKELIGRGGMGEVYSGVQARLGRPVAVKILRNSRQEQASSHIHFLKEMEIVGKLDHPNLVRAYDAWESDGYLYLVFELLDGQSVQTLVDSGSIGSASEVYKIIHETLEGLRYLHSNDIVHHDIKPGNVIVGRCGQVKIIDFGLSSYRDSAHLKGYSTVGTKGFMAPEPPSSDPQKDRLRDIFSTGALLRYLINSVGPLEDSHQRDWLGRLSVVAERMCQADPQNRLPNIDTAIAELEETQPTSLVAAAWTQMQLARWFTLLLGVLTLIGLLGYGYFNSGGQSREALRKSPASGAGIITPELVLVPSGIFQMGALDGDEDAKAVEYPRRTVEFKNPFYIGKYEVTVAEFGSFVKASGYQTLAQRNGVGGWKSGVATSWGEQSVEFNWMNPGYLSSSVHPVSLIAFEDAVAYCDWLSSVTGRRFRLPTEAEWEYACRAGDPNIFPFEFSQRTNYSWTRYNTTEELTARPVGTKLPNRWGIHDMVGNLREWCSDYYSDRAYDVDYSASPKGPETGTLRAIRGSAFLDGQPFMRSSNRGYLRPDMVVNNQGFRVVCEE